MDIVCASLCASQCERSVPYVDRSRAAAGASAFYGEGLRDIVLGNEVVAAFGFGFSFWLHQWRIPHRMCRFYLLLAGAVEERQGISIPYPSPTPLLTPGGIRCGGALLLPRAYRDLVSLCPVLSLLPSSEFCTAICVRLCIVRVSVGVPSLGRSFFIIGEGAVRSCGYVGVCYGLSLELPLTANGTSIWRIRGKENRILSFHLQYGTVSYHSIGNYIQHSLPVDGG